MSHYSYKPDRSNGGSTSTAPSSSLQYIHTSGSGSSNGAGLSRLFSIRRRQPPTLDGEQSDSREELQAVAFPSRDDLKEDRVDCVPFPSVAIPIAPTDRPEDSTGTRSPFGGYRPPLHPSGSNFNRSQSLKSASVLSHTYSKARRLRQTSLSASEKPSNALLPGGLLQDSSARMESADLNKSSPAVNPASSHFSSFLRKSSRHARARTANDVNVLDQSSYPRKAEGRSRKLSLSGLNFFRTHSHADKIPSTPEIETWKEKGATMKNSEEANLHYIREAHTGRDPTFLSELDAISPGWPATSVTTKRKPVPPLDLSAINNAESTLDSPLPSFHENYRPYSLISTDTEGNDTPIIRLSRMIVDTKESEEDQERQSRLFFRPVASDAYLASSGSVSPEAELIQDQPSSDATASHHNAGLPTTDAGGQSSGSSTLNARLISEQMRVALQQQRQEASQAVEPARRNKIPSFHPDLQDDNQLQFQQRQPPRSANMRRETFSSPVYGLTRSSLSARPSSEVKRESLVSSRTDSSVDGAVLGRATSTRLHSVPLRLIKVEEWAQQLSQGAKGGADEEVDDMRIASGIVDIPDIPDEAASSRDDVTSGQIQSREDAPSSEQRNIQTRQSSSSISEAARLGRTSSKRLRSQPIEDGSGSDKPAVESVEESQKMPSVQAGVKQKKSRDTNATRTRSNTNEDVSKKEKHRHRERSRGKPKKSYLTSEDAATAKRKEQEDREARSKERRLKRELARQEAYAEEKRNDPLLKMRLALVGLSALDDEASIEREEEKATQQLQLLKQSNESALALSKSSFYTAHEEEEQQQMAEKAMSEELSNTTPFQQHRRNQTFTTSTITLPTFPHPPHRYDSPTRSEDGTVLARARLQSQDVPLPLHQSAAMDSWSETPKAELRQLFEEGKDAVLLVDGHRLALSHGEWVRTSPAMIRQPALVNDQEEYDLDNIARLRRSHVPEVFDRFSLQSFVN